MRLGAFLAGKALEEWGAVWRGKTPRRLGSRLAGQSPGKTAVRIGLPSAKSPDTFDGCRQMVLGTKKTTKEVF